MSLTGFGIFLAIIIQQRSQFIFNKSKNILQIFYDPPRIKYDKTGPEGNLRKSTGQFTSDVFNKWFKCFRFIILNADYNAVELLQGGSGFLLQQFPSCYHVSLSQVILFYFHLPRLTGNCSLRVLHTSRHQSNR